MFHRYFFKFFFIIVKEFISLCCFYSSHSQNFQDVLFIMEHLKTRIKILPQCDSDPDLWSHSFIIFSFSALSLHCHYFAVLFDHLFLPLKLQTASLQENAGTELLPKGEARAIPHLPRMLCATLPVCISAH